MGHAFGIFMAHVGTLQSLRSFRRRLPLALGFCMKNYLTLAALLSTIGLAHANERLSPEQVIAHVKAKGASAVVGEIWSSESQTKIFLAGVGSGNVAWLKAAQAIEPATDAGSAEDLADALADALVHNPYAALPWLRELWWQADPKVCVFAYDSELPGGVSAYIARLEAALSKPSPPQLRKLRTLCLKGINQTKQAIATTPE